MSGTCARIPNAKILVYAGVDNDHHQRVISFTNLVSHEQVRSALDLLNAFYQDVCGDKLEMCCCFVGVVGLVQCS